MSTLDTDCFLCLLITFIVNLQFMNNLGYTRVAAAVPAVKPGDISFNVSRIEEMTADAREAGAEIILFPELAITGYSCGDLFFQDILLENAEKALTTLARNSAISGVAIIVGVPLRINGLLFNCAAVLSDGEIKGIVPKTHLPNYNEFYEKRWFTPADSAPRTTILGDKEVECSTNLIFSKGGTRFAIEICEDLWVPAPPSCRLSQLGAQIIFNLSASDEQAGKHAYLRSLIAQQSARCRAAYIYASAGAGESSTDLAFPGKAIIAENGNIIGESERFSLSPSLLIRDIDVNQLSNDRLKYSTFHDNIHTDGYNDIKVINVDSTHYPEDPSLSPLPIEGNRKSLLHPLSPNPFTGGSAESFRERCEEISSIQAWGLMQRLNAIGCKKAVIGISGGLDSTLALLVTVKAFDRLGLDRKGIVAITMPGFGTTGRTHDNAAELMRLLGVTSLEIPIAEAVNLHFKDIGQDPEKHDATYENSQARERTQILMDMANKTGGIVIGTGDLSELALGWCTYNGDQMSMYGVNASVPKTLVKYLVKGYAATADDTRVAEVLLDIIDTPISPELLPAGENDTIDQKTEDLVGPYELHDFFIYNMLRNSFSPRKIFILATLAFEDEYTPGVIKHWLKTFYRRFFNQQFKRSCMPDGVKVGSVCLSPRGDWRMPSDASSRLWLDEVESL